MYAILSYYELDYADHREMTLEKNEACRSCHEQEYEISGPSAHANVFNAGNRDSALCIDCHGSHEITNPREPRAKAVQICGECHKAAYSTYLSSVHGSSFVITSYSIHYTKLYEVYKCRCNLYILPELRRKFLLDNQGFGKDPRCKSHQTDRLLRLLIGPVP